jgi:predicted nucleic acid-binding protein
MARVVLDSSCLIALFNVKDSHHKLIRSQITERNIYAASTISITESLVRESESNSFKNQLSRLKMLVSEIVPVDEEIALLATEIRAKHPIKTPDSIISATAKLTNATLWTFDKALAKAHTGAVLIK